MMNYDTFFQATEIPKCGRGPLLRAIDGRLRACDGGVTAAKLIALLTAVDAWGYKKGAKHGEHPTANFNLRMQAVKQLVGEIVQELNALGMDGRAIREASNSYEKHKRAGKRKGLQSLGKGYHFERLQFMNTKKAGVDKDTKIMPKGGSFVSEALKSAKDLRANYKQQIARGVDTQDTLGQMVDDESMIALLLSKEIGDLKEAQFNAVFDAASGGLSGQNTPEVNFLRKTERIQRFLTWCEGGLFYKQANVPYTTAGRDIYAMDKYGNLITMSAQIFYNKNNQKYGANGNVQHNHSSLNAGGDVISAGEIAFQNGYITHIDNHSGHYRPTAKQVQNCVYSLRMADDADLSRLLSIEVVHKGADRQFNDVTTFLAARF